MASPLWLSALRAAGVRHRARVHGIRASACLLAAVSSLAAAAVAAALVGGPGPTTSPGDVPWVELFVKYFALKPTIYSFF